jgi:plastocyanin
MFGLMGRAGVVVGLIVGLAACAPTEEMTPEPTETPTEEVMEEPTETPTEEMMEEPTETPTEEMMEEPTETPSEPSMVTPSVTVMDQALTGNTVTVDEVVSDGAGWMVIHADQEGAPGPVIGYSAVPEGTSTDVTVEVDVSGLTGTLYAMLHEDTGEMDTYEFPDADPPVKVDDQVVVQPFSVDVSEGEATIEMVDISFDPAYLVVRSGTTVTWINMDGVEHNTVSDDGVWQSDLLSQEESFDYTFEEPGVYPYYCEPHGGPGGEGMSGTIVVVP